MSSPFVFTRLSDRLVLITWTRTPDKTAEEDYLKQLGELLDASEKPGYFISDIRKGRIIGMRSIQKLSEFTAHKNWAGSTAFSKDPVSKILLNSFKALSAKSESRNEMHTTPEEAIGFIESLEPGITKDIVWDTVLAK